jgi:hypothetical protein
MEEAAESANVSNWAVSMAPGAESLGITAVFRGVVRGDQMLTGLQPGSNQPFGASNADGYPTNNNAEENNPDADEDKED